MEREDWRGRERKGRVAREGEEEEKGGRWGREGRGDAAREKVRGSEEKRRNQHVVKRPRWCMIGGGRGVPLLENALFVPVLNSLGPDFSTGIGSPGLKIPRSNNRD